MIAFSGLSRHSNISETIRSFAAKILSSILNASILSTSVAFLCASLNLSFGLFERYIGILLPKKVPKRKTCQILRKRLICDYLLLNCITAKQFEI